MNQALIVVLFWFQTGCNAVGVNFRGGVRKREEE